ncbi:uncharacterized protein LOC133662547 isoform X1 [Entelurus aequoreus]|uniref:uncharacterized protein LOC133662547 isoform X1 n=1 Tax=Entelurus aequoreus TaxID=161455 RepID=UPI002B1E4331|nr:uncharacterized protein LOC133662547 isoform X1 [Entelurus aequoreus]
MLPVSLLPEILPCRLLRLLMLSHFLLLVSHFLLLVSHFLLLVSHFLLLVSHFLVLVSHFLLLVSHFLLLVSHFLVLTLADTARCTAVDTCTADPGASWTLSHTPLT